MDWDLDKLDEESKRNCYESYRGEIWYEDGDKAPHMTYEEWCKESEEFGEPIGPFL